MFLISLFFGSLIGFVLGAFGGGGSLFAVPVLVFFLNVPIHQAPPVSLTVVGTTALLGWLLHLKKGQTHYKVGITFALAGSLFSPLGQGLAKNLSPQLLLSLFSLLMIGLGFKIFFHHHNEDVPIKSSVQLHLQNLTPPLPPYLVEFSKLLKPLVAWSLIILAGVLVGFLTGLFGVGGGFLIIPLLVLLTAMSMSEAVTTSLFIITLISISGVLHAISKVPDLLHFPISTFLVGSLLGVIVSVPLTKHFSGHQIQKGLGSLMILVGLVQIFTLNFK